MPYDTRDKVRLLLAEGRTPAEVAMQLGLAKSTVAYHRRMLGHMPDPRFARRYDWAEVQRYCDEGHSMRECLERFGMGRDTWYAAIRRGDLAKPVWPTPLEELLVANTARSRYNLKLRLVGAGLKEGCCEACGISSWRGQPLSLSLHHMNGDRLDNRIENLRMLCPNCHSQTPNFGSRNRRSTPAPPAVSDSRPG